MCEQTPMLVHIGPFTYPVKVIPELKSASNGGALWGEIVYSKHEIRVRDDGPAERRKVAVLHEIIHGCLDLTGHGDAVEEKVVEALGAALYDSLTRSGLLTIQDPNHEED
ncbi:MAG: hypothetical protein ACYC5Y_05175 [Symbiobacteriia bacterium]